MAQPKRPTDTSFDFDDEPRIAELRAQIEELKSALRGAKPAGVSATGHTPELFLLVLALLFIFRLALYVEVEAMYSTARIATLPADVLFAALGVAVFGLWMFVEGTTRHWLLIPKALFLLVAGAIVGSIFSDGGIWSGTMVSATGHPGLALGLMLGAVFITASPFWGWFMSAGVAFLTDPIATVRKIFKEKTHG